MASEGFFWLCAFKNLLVTQDRAVSNYFFIYLFSSEKQIKYDTYLVPFTLYELGLLYKQQDEREKAIRYIETAK